MLEMEPDDPQTLTNLAECHHGRTQDQVCMFWSECSKFLSKDVGLAVDDRRHTSVTHLAKVISAHDLLEQVTRPFIQGDARAQHLAMQVIHGVADRDPLGERRLVEWCLGIPSKLYFHGGRTRRLIRLLMRDRLPEEILSGPPARQAADRHLHLSRALPRIREMLNGWRGDPAVAGRIDLDRLLRVVDTWPASAPLSPRDHPDHLIVTSGLDRAISAGRFIRWVERGYQSA